MNPNTLLEKYQTLLPWNLARTKCFINMILGVIASGSVQQNKTALCFTGAAKQTPVCARIRNFLKSFKLNYDDYARAILEIAGLKGPLPLALDRTNWKFVESTLIFWFWQYSSQIGFLCLFFGKHCPKRAI